MEAVNRISSILFSLVHALIFQHAPQHTGAQEDWLYFSEAEDFPGDSIGMGRRI